MVIGSRACSRTASCVNSSLLRKERVYVNPLVDGKGPPLSVRKQPGGGEAVTFTMHCNPHFDETLTGPFLDIVRSILRYWFA